ncbi:MAG TPA: PIG-L family deacetylase [Chthoniobacterales bacterium]
MQRTDCGPELTASGDAPGLLTAFCASAGCQVKVLLLAAHPDDEVIGASTRLRELRENMFIVFATDGAVRQGREEGWRAVAARRHHEAETVMKQVGIPGGNVFWLDHADQSASAQLPALIRELTELVLAVQPAVLVTHPYEGGHPDHDACAFAAQVSIARLGADGPVRLEMTSYHDHQGCFRAGAFLPAGNTGPTVCLALTNAEQLRKRELFGRYESQREVLQSFQVDHEAFRVAPTYDFTRPPHAGTLYYERFAWGMPSGQAWRALGRAALDRADRNSL